MVCPGDREGTAADPRFATDEPARRIRSLRDTPGNRVAIVAKDPLFWVVAREKLAEGDDVEIKLPASGSLAVDLDLPSKPAEQEVLVELRSFDQSNWNPDFLRFHFGTHGKNPGETVFEHLPPATYAVERNELTKTGRRSVLMT